MILGISVYRRKIGERLIQVGRESVFPTHTVTNLKKNTATEKLREINFDMFKKVSKTAL